jgi:hypothetical protein
MNTDFQLRQWPETMYVSKNPMLKEILSSWDSIPENADLLTLIRNGKWSELDAYIRERPGKLEFQNILAQYLIFRHRNTEPITRKEFETAMGIQQVRWMVDPDNCRSFKNYVVHDATFSYFQDISIEEQTLIINEMIWDIQYKGIDKKYKTIEGMQEFFQGTIWYDVKYVGVVGSWKGFGLRGQWFPISETINLSTIACIYAPQLVFGALSDLSLFKHIVNYEQRPYIAHIPDAKSNLCDIHNIKHMVVAAWMHDFSHSRGGGGCYDGLRYINNQCKENGVPVNLTNVAQIKDDINNESSPLYQCFIENIKRMKNIENGIIIARRLNDNGVIHHVPFPAIRGGKRKTRRMRKSKRSKRTRK